MSSPAQWEKLGKSWDAFAKTPSGTGPWKLTLFAPRERAEMVPNKDYWDKARVPKLDKLVLLPLPEANARVAALRAGQVDWIEAPAPDAVASLKQAKFNIVINAYPHNWTWHLSRAPRLALERHPGAQGRQPRDRPRRHEGTAAGPDDPGRRLHAAGPPVVRQAVVQGEVRSGGGEEAARRSRLQHRKPLVVKVLISPSGSGQMQPLPMNEFVQQNLAEVGIKVEFEVVDWNQLINIWRAGATDPASKGGHSINFTYFIQDPFTGFIRHLQCDLKAPKGTNWGHYCDPEMDKLLDAVRTTFDPEGTDSRCCRRCTRNTSMTRCS